MLDVEQWAQVRRMYFVDRVSIKEIARRTGLARNTIRSALRSGDPPRYERGERPSKLDCFKDEHGARCGICIAEAEVIEGMAKAGRPETEVRARLVKEYGEGE